MPWKEGIATLLAKHGIRPSAQRMAVADYVLETKDHPTADQVLLVVAPKLPMLSRATVYNTLNLFVRRGLLRLHHLDGRVVYDPRIARHHHFIDQFGRIHDVPWDAAKVQRIRALDGFQVNSYQVVMRGRIKKP